MNPYALSCRLLLKTNEDVEKHRYTAYTADFLSSFNRWIILHLSKIKRSAAIMATRRTNVSEKIFIIWIFIR